MREGSVSVHRITERTVVQTGTVGYNIIIIIQDKLSYAMFLHANYIL